MNDNTTVDGNATIGFNETISDEDLAFQIVSLYLPLGLRPIMSILVVYLALCAIDAIRTTRQRHAQRFDSIEFFFLINLLISDIVTVVISNVVSMSVILNTLANPDAKGVKCYIIAASKSPICATLLFVVLVCFDRMMFITMHDRYVRFMTKKKCYIIIGMVWVLTVVSNVLLVFDPTMELKSTNGVCIHKPFHNHYKTVSLIVPALLSVAMVIIQNSYLFYLAYQSNAEQDRQMTVSGITAHSHNNHRNQESKSQFLRVLKKTRRSAFTAILLATSHLIFGAGFPVMEYLICPMYKDRISYVALTSVVFVFFEFVNLMIHPLLYGFYVRLIRRHLRHRHLYLCLCYTCCKPCRRCCDV